MLALPGWPARLMSMAEITLGLDRLAEFCSA
jgi:hypothetical protein